MLPHHELTHDLRSRLRELARLPTRQALESSAGFREVAGEIERVLGGFEWDFRGVPPARGRTRDRIRVTSWNVERGKRFEALRGVVDATADLRDADLLLLCEVDVGMGRSGNRNVPRELARALDCGYLFANYHLVLAAGDSAEQDHGVENTLGLHGAALLTRWPITRFDAVALPEFVDKFRAIEKRLGSKRALLAEVMLPDGPLTVAHVHLDPFSPPAHRARQMRLVLDAVDRFGGERVLVGGDFNTNTYHLGSKPGLAVDIVHKLVRFGFEGTVEQYMTPDAYFERALFDELRRGGYETRGFTDPQCGTIHYDLNDPEVVDKSLQYLPGFAYRWLERRLRRWGGRVPMRLDHFAGRGLQPLAARTIDRPKHEGVRVSDHNPIVVELALGG